MNPEDVVWQGKRNKRLCVDELKTDYSGVYLQNEKLEQALNRFLEKLQKDRRRQREQHEADLGQLKKEIDTMNGFLNSSSGLVFNQPLTVASTTRIPVPQLSLVKRDPTTFPAKWFTSAFIPADKELNKIKRQRFANPPLPFIRRSKTDMHKKSAKDKENMADEDISGLKIKRVQSEKAPRTIGGINRSKTEIGTRPIQKSAIPTVGQGHLEQMREQSSLSLTKSNRGSASIYAGRAQQDTSVIKEQGSILLEFMAQRSREASGRSRMQSRGSSRFAERGREPSGRSIARSLGKQDFIEDVEDTDIEELAPVATVATRSVRELKAMALNSQSDRLPNPEVLRKQRMLDSSKRKSARIVQKMKTFIKSIEDELEHNKEEEKQKKFVDFMF